MASVKALAPETATEIRWAKLAEMWTVKVAVFARGGLRSVKPQGMRRSQSWRMDLGNSMTALPN
jgi:hypothetical protein